MYTVFIDGQEGTTGLKIHERLKGRNDLQLLEIPYEERKNSSVKSKYLNEADVVIFCLPDVAAKESAAMVTNPKTRIIDASTAFRTHEDWVYGMPELNSQQRSVIKNAHRISNPGCHATGFVLTVVPLIEAGIISRDYTVTATSVTGYSGGGKKLISKYQSAPASGIDLNGPRHYALGLAHKHLPEMKKYSQLTSVPLFLPIVSNFYNGMVVTIPLHVNLLLKKISVVDLHEIMVARYEKEPFVKVMPLELETFLDEGFLDPTVCNDTNRFEIIISGTKDQLLVMGRFDNLGKGASGAAVQNMNIALGLEETSGLKS
jgi:N-acetyl-gamma-glutamyl-phosphate reductase